MCIFVGRKLLLFTFYIPKLLKWLYSQNNDYDTRHGSM